MQLREDRSVAGGAGGGGHGSAGSGWSRRSERVEDDAYLFIYLLFFQSQLIALLVMVFDFFNLVIN